jgi:hypothetical protein
MIPRPVQYQEDWRRMLRRSLMIHKKVTCIGEEEARIMCGAFYPLQDSILPHMLHFLPHQQTLE